MSPRAQTTVEVKRLNMNVPKGLHDAFKAATAAEGKQMTDVLMDFIRTYVQQHQPGRVRRGGRK
jgi:ParG